MLLYSNEGEGGGGGGTESDPFSMMSQKEKGTDLARLQTAFKGGT